MIAIESIIEIFQKDKKVKNVLQLTLKWKYIRRIQRQKKRIHETLPI